LIVDTPNFGRKRGDKNGKLVIEPKYRSADRFSEGLAAVRIGEKVGYIDRNGEIAITPQFARAAGFSEGLALVYIGNKYGYIDKSGKLVIEPRFDEAGSFSDGLAMVSIGNETGYIDHTGSLIIKLQFEYLGGADDFSEGLAVITLLGDKLINGRRMPYKNVYVDKSGKLTDPQGALGPEIILGSSFYGGLAVAAQVMEDKFGKLGYSDRDGNLVISPQFDAARPFYNQELAAVRLDGKWGFIDKRGRDNGRL
jgi:WG containing repeat